MDGQQHMPADEVIAGIKAELQKYEAERVTAHKAVSWRVPVFLGALLVATLLLAIGFNSFASPYEQWTSTPHVFLYFIAFGASFFIYSWAMKPATNLQQSFRDKILPVVFGFIEDVSYRQGYQPDSFDRLPRETMDSFNRQRFDDLVTGKYEGFPFELCEVSLSRKSGKTEAQVFKGIIVAFETITSFPGVLVAARKKSSVTSFFRGLFGTSLQEVASGVPELDESYEFRTDNVEAARPLVTGRLAKALRWLGETWPEQPARVALRGSDGFLLIPVTKNFFELPAISVSLDYKAHVEPMIADMAALLATAALVRKIGAADDAPDAAQA